LRVSYFEWDDYNVNHIAEHGVDPLEVEEVFKNRPLIRKGRQGLYQAFGQTDEGYYLFVVFRHKGKETARVITARDMDEAERRYYQRHGK